MEFNEELAKSIVDKIHNKGWNIYYAGLWQYSGDDGIIREGPIDKIEYNKPYMLFPMTSKPNDPTTVKMELMLLSTDSNYTQESTNIFRGNRPYISINGFETVLFAFKLYPEGVGFFPNPSKKDVLALQYPEFLKSLDTLVENIHFSEEDIWEDEY